MNIIQGFPLPQKGQYKVYIRSITYNHAPYIKDCLNGVAMQKTDFPFVHHVIDDASTDGEQEVIKSWIEKNCDIDTAEFYDNDVTTITLAKIKNNPDCTLAVYFLKKNMYRNPEKRKLFTPWQAVCPYEALCEGDDYWTDPLKLKKQVVFLDSNPDYVLVHTAFDRFHQEKSVVFNNSKIWPSGDVKEYLLSGSYNIGTLTIMMRIDAFNKIPKLYKNQKFLMGDLPVWIELSMIGKIKFIEDKTSVYRILPNSAAHNKDISKEIAFIKNTFYIREFYAKKYGFNDIDWEYKVCTSLIKLAYYRNCKDLALTSYLQIKSKGKQLGFKFFVIYTATQFKFIKLILNTLYKSIR